MANVLLGAHLGGRGRAQLPSIFDYLAQEALANSLKPGLRAAVKLLGQFFPRGSAFAERRFDELFLLFQALLENHYLAKFSASFAENFYGLKRVHLRAGASFGTFRKRIRSLIALVLLPYLADKMQKMHEKLRDQAPTSGWGRLFLRLFPRLKSLTLAAIFAFQVAYSFSLSTVPSPLLLLAGCGLERLGPEEIARFQSAGSAPLHMRRGSLLASIWRLCLWLPSAIGRLLSYGLFLLQFLEYFYTDDLAKQFGQVVAGQRLNIPEFPYQKLPSEQQVLCMEVDKCPLCKRVRQQDAVLSVSGYVFCHACIYNFVVMEGRCPVTNLPASSSDLVQLYH